MVGSDREGQMQTVASRAGYGRWGHSPAQYAEKRWREYLPAAEFALAALREPTEAMKTYESPDGDRVHWGHRCHYCGGHETAWKLLIDAALEAKP
mgnify:CR=1 FL=1